MSTEYAVLDQDGKQMGLPARSWTTQDAANEFKWSLEQARVRAMAEGRAAEVVLAGDSGSQDKVARSFREELEGRVAKGKHAAGVAYRIMQREVGPWTTT